MAQPTLTLVEPPRPRMDILVQRQLDSISAGNDAYLETFLKVVRKAGYDVRIVFAPRHSFGNRPWMAMMHPRIAELVDEVVWPGGVTLGGKRVSLSPLVWWRFAKRLVTELRLRAGQGVIVKSYLGRPLPEGEAKAVADICNASPAAVTIAEYSSLGPVLDDITAPTRKGVFSHDCLSDRVIRLRSAGLPVVFYEVTPEEEAAWCAPADFIVYASANEQASFGAKLKGTDGVWLRPEPPDYDPVPEGEGPARIVFIGTTHAGNTDALQHFLDDIWPLVLKQAPDLEFHIAGSVGKTVTAEQAALPGVRVLGRVDDLRDVGGPYAIGVAPTRLATGVSIKVAEYLVLDMPTVAYPLALEGFGDALDGLVQVEATPQAFADRLVAMARGEVQAGTARPQRIARSPARAKRLGEGACVS